MSNAVKCPICNEEFYTYLEYNQHIQYEIEEAKVVLKVLKELEQ